MASPSTSPAPPLHVQHLEKALRLEPFFGFVEGVFSDQFLGNLSDSDNSGLSDLERDFTPKGKDGLLNGDNGALVTNGFLQPEELKIDKTRLYNFSKIKKERRWLMDLLLSDSSESSDEDEPLGEEDLQQMLWFHKQQKKAQQRYYQDGDLSRYQHYSTSLLYSQDKYHDLQKQTAQTKKVKKKMKDGKVKLVKVKKEKVKVKKRKKSDDQIDDQRKLSIEERVYKKVMIRRKEVDAKRRKIWAIICRKEIPRAQRQKASARNNMLSNAKKLAQLCQKERRREAQRSQRICQQTVPRARRLSREMLAYWKKYEKVEKEHRKRAEKEAMEQRKMDDELREARRQQRKLNFLITQTELYAHFMSKKLKNSRKNTNSEAVQSILKKLDEPSSSNTVKTVQGGVVFDMENLDNYDAKAMKMEALANAENAMKEQEARTQEFDASIPAQDHGGNKKVPLSQESFDENFSLANPNLTIDHPQPDLFQGILKTYQLKGMNWLITLYEQGINGILADEMGLGKTVQSIAFLSYLAEAHHIWGPFLVVAPASTLHNWQQEVARFIPNFKVLPYWGNQSDRKSLRKFWSQKQGHISDKDHAPFHLLITSYQLVVQDVRYFQRIKWQYIVLDEAQAIKSSSSVRWKILLGYQCRNRLLLTGTPIQNSMAELWALLHFIMPTLFDSHEEFNEWFSKDIESHAENKSIIDQNQLSRLHMILKPFMLRRIKRDVENELSEKIEIKLVCGMTTRQRWLYQAVKNKISIDDLVYTSASSSSAANATTSSLMNLVMQFRKVCNHPELFERRDVYSPLSTFQLSSYLIPKLVYREGHVQRMFPGCSKVLYNTINIWTSEYITNSLHSRPFGNQNVPESPCFSFLPFINVSPEEAAAFMQRGLTYRLLLLLILLREVRHLYHRQFWSLRKSHSKRLGRQSLLLWPSLNTSFPNIETSPVLSSIVFTSYNKSILAHITHRIQPILDEKDLSPRKAGPSRPHPTSPLKHSSSGPFSPPGHHHHHKHHHKHHHHHHHRHHHKGGHSPSGDQKGSVYAYPEGHTQPIDPIGLPMRYPQQRHLQPTDVPSLLLTYIPKIVSGNNLSYCSDRSAAYEVEDLVNGGSELKRNLLLYGDPEGCDLKKLKTQLFPPPPGGLEGSRPPKGWSFVQIPRRSALITDSGKLTVLDGLLTKLKMQGHRVLIYSQMTRMIDILEEFMTYRKHKYMRLDGSSKISDRRDMVADFQNNKDIFVFLLSTRAGGLGINLTAADTVIFYDSDWNPTVDQQAMDRAHRLGQTRQVTVYRLVTKNTIEERILQRAKEKSEIQKMVISGGHFKPDALKPKEVVSLLLDDEELENKFLQRQAEKKADEQRKRRERKRKKGLPEDTNSPLLAETQSTPPPKAKKGRKSKSSLFPPAPETAVSLSEAGSINGLITGDMDDSSVMSFDEVSVVSNDDSTLSTDVNQSNVATPSSVRPDNDDSMTVDDPSSETASPSTVEPPSKRGKGRGRGRGRARGSSMRGRGTGPIRLGRGRGRGRGSSGALAASAAASAAAAAASAAAYGKYGFTFQGTPTLTATPPPSRSSPVAFGGGLSGNSLSQPVPRYDSSSSNSNTTGEQT